MAIATIGLAVEGFLMFPALDPDASLGLVLRVFTLISTVNLVIMVILRKRTNSIHHQIKGRLARLTLPSRATVADSLLIFVTDPDAAEVLVGDLVEKMAQVRARKSASLAWCWFWWEVVWITVHQIMARIKDKTVLGKLGDAIIKRIGG